MVFSRDVDVCVTCITSKPPKLPLREEFLSLGVEVIYKAAGVGAQAARDEARQKVKEYREHVMKKSQQSLGPRDASKSLDEERKQRIMQRTIERVIFQRRSSISYNAYAQRLTRQDSTESDSLCSMDAAHGFCTNLTTSESPNDRHMIGSPDGPDGRDGEVSPVADDEETRHSEDYQQGLICGQRSHPSENLSLHSQPEVHDGKLNEVIHSSPSLAQVVASFDGQLELHNARHGKSPDHPSEKSVALVKRTLDMLDKKRTDKTSGIKAILVFRDGAQTSEGGEGGN